MLAQSTTVQMHMISNEKFYTSSTSCRMSENGAILIWKQNTDIKAKAALLFTVQHRQWNSSLDWVLNLVHRIIKFTKCIGNCMVSHMVFLWNTCHFGFLQNEKHTHNIRHTVYGTNNEHPTTFLHSLCGSGALFSHKK